MVFFRIIRFVYKVKEVNKIVRIGKGERKWLFFIDKFVYMDFNKRIFLFIRMIKRVSKVVRYFNI